MRPFWAPMSAVFLPDPLMLATPAVLRLALSRARGVELLYAGDRMSPAIVPLQSVVVDRVEGAALSSLEAGQIVLAVVGGVPDLLRIARIGNKDLELVGDA